MLAQKKLGLTQYVNTFTGTGGLGNTYPGAAYPFGMVQLSPDNGYPGWDRISGYFYADSTIAGFSHTHLTGTGAGDLYDILVMPYNSRFTESLTADGDYRPYSKFKHQHEKASPGYYQVDLESSGIKAELTASAHCGMHRYTFPADEQSKILIDLAYAMNWDAPVKTFLKIEDQCTISGYRYSTGWSRDQRVHFVIKLSKPFDQAQLYEGEKKVAGQEIEATKTKLILSFKTKKHEVIELKTGLSSVSIPNAAKHIEQEIPNWDFDKTVQTTQTEWDRVLSQLKVEGSKAQKELFYTNLYHCFLTPILYSDFDGSYYGANGKVCNAEGFKRYDTFSLWDTYRAAHPLYTLLCPDVVSDFVRSFLAHYSETGLLPVWPLWGQETNMMIGYHAVPVIVDAYFKGIPFDAEKAFQACKASAMDTSRSIDEYRQYGFVPADGKEKGNWSVSKTMEYAYDDWCIAQMAKALGKTQDAELFAKRASNWKNHYDVSSRFFRPRKKNGDFLSPFTPKEYTEQYCESNAWQYFWAAQHDIDGLISLMGKARFEQRLDSMFSFKPEKDDKLPLFSTGMIGQYAHGNEPVHHVAYLYDYIGKAWKTQELVRQISSTLYHTSLTGYCGNEDCGQMSAWYIFSAMGFYPVNPASGEYALGAPQVPKVVIQLPNHQTFSVEAKGLSDDNKYVASISLNGKPYFEKYIQHRDLLKGGKLIFTMTNKPLK